MIGIDLAGKTSIITGASQGLGLATATALYRAGANVVINYFPDPNGIHAAQAEHLVALLGERAIAVPADIRNDEQVALLVESAVNSFGSLDILINNAAVLRDKTMKKMQMDDWEDVIEEEASQPPLDNTDEDQVLGDRFGFTPDGVAAMARPWSQAGF